MRTKIIVTIILSLFLYCKQQNNQEKILIPEFQIILDNSKVDGSILIFDSYKDKYYSNNFTEAEKSVIPASTFKIPHSIIGLETNILDNEETVFKWNGKKEHFLFGRKI